MINRQIVIIGAGVTGSSIARELSKRKLDILVLERASDVCEGTSKANSGIVHAGYDAKPGTLKARLNLEGSRMMPELSKELDFPYRNNGSIVLCFDEADMGALNDLYERGMLNGVEGLRILNSDEVHEIEPNVADDVYAALYAPTGGIVCPFNLNIAMAENAVVNGAEFWLDTEVVNVSCDERGGGYNLEIIKHPSMTRRTESDECEVIHADIVINAAGVYADRFHNMVSEKKIHITPRKGEYCLLDKKVGNYVSSTLFQLPTAKGKGVLVTPTVHGNLLVGPTAVDVDDHDMTDTTADGLAYVGQTGAKSVKALPIKGNIITSFSGLRAHEDGGDFIIEEVQDAPGFIDAAGIESPGLSCAPAVGVYVAGIVDGIIPSEMKENFISERKGIVSMASADESVRQAMIDTDDRYANVVCRCELVTEGEIVAAINRPLGATTLDGVKRRTRAGMGRCQAGFCTPRQVAILAAQLNCDIDEITKKGITSELICGYPKESTMQKGGSNE